ncbi:MAG: isoprenylcysteine carboxylmethyltransferase family protein [Nitrospirae bacterium]|nr:isoprenylcysteine carboxylmethyltransferase family protein [Nitrospirota bacterium]
MKDALALIALILWPVVPLFWIPVHCVPQLFRKLGFFTYGMPVITWLPLVFLLYQNREFLLAHKISFAMPITVLGAILLFSGTMLHIWTGWLLGLWGLIGLPEIHTKVTGKLMTKGPFSVVRHPTYLAHSLMFSGVFLITGVITVGIVTALDFAIVYLAVIPLEERELSRRFGEEYEKYKKAVPKFFPRIK